MAIGSGIGTPYRAAASPASPAGLRRRHGLAGVTGCCGGVTGLAGVTGCCGGVTRPPPGITGCCGGVTGCCGGGTGCCGGGTGTTSTGITGGGGGPGTPGGGGGPGTPGRWRRSGYAGRWRRSGYAGRWRRSGYAGGGAVAAGTARARQGHHSARHRLGSGEIAAALPVNENEVVDDQNGLDDDDRDWSANQPPSLPDVVGCGWGVRFQQGIAAFTAHPRSTALVHQHSGSGLQHRLQGVRLPVGEAMVRRPGYRRAAEPA